MKRIILFFAALSAVSVSCNKENPELNNTAQAGAEVKIYATAPGVKLPATQNQVSPKSVLGADGFSVLWEDGDQIKMCATPKASQYNSATEQATSLFTTSLSEASGTAMFSGTNAYTDYHQQNTILIYPSSVEYSATRSGTTVTESVKFNLPDEQVAGTNGNIRGGYNLSSTFANGYNIKNGAIPQVAFKNSCALIRLVLSAPSASDIKSVTVSSSVPLAGYASLRKSEVKDDRYNFVGFDLSFASSLDNNSSVTLTNGGKAFEQGVEYNIVVWPGTHSNLTFTFENSAGLKCVKNVGKQVVLVESEIDRFNFTSAFEFKEVATLEVSKESLSAGKDMTSLTFTLSSNVDWSVISDQSWVSVTPSSGGAVSNSTITVSVQANPTYEYRSAVLQVRAGDLVKNITVTQEAALRPTYKIIDSKLTYASDLVNGFYVIANKYSSSMFWTESDGKLSMSSHSVNDTFGQEHVFEYVSNVDKIDKSIDNYKSWSAGAWKSLSTGKYLDENFNLNAELSNALYLVSANNWGGNGGGELDGFDVYHSKTTSSTKCTLWYNGSEFRFGDMNLYYNSSVDVGKRKYYVYKVVRQ